MSKNPVSRNLVIERLLDDWARARLPAGLGEFVMFTLKQGWACLFGGLLLAGILSALALWVAENVGTATGTWLYSGQIAGQAVSFAKLGSWYLLLYVAFVTVTLVSRSALGPDQAGQK